VEVRNSEILTERKREATPPIPIALTVFETVQYAEKPLGWVKAMSTIAGRVARASRSRINAGSLLTIDFHERDAIQFSGDQISHVIVPWKGLQMGWEVVNAKKHGKIVIIERGWKLITGDAEGVDKTFDRIVMWSE